MVGQQGFGEGSVLVESRAAGCGELQHEAGLPFCAVLQKNEGSKKELEAAL